MTKDDFVGTGVLDGPLFDANKTPIYKDFSGYWERTVEDAGPYNTSSIGRLPSRFIKI